MMDSTVSSFNLFCSSPLKNRALRSRPNSRIKCSWKIPCGRRSILLHGGVTLTALNGYIAAPLKAEESNSKPEEEQGLGEIITSLFDTNEKTKSGKILPKAYLKSVREVVKTLRESLEEDGKDVAKFRRTADAAKESIREYLSSWRGQKSVAAEESYVALEKAIRSLAGFYAKAGPFASMPDDIKAGILENLNNAEASL